MLDTSPGRSNLCAAVIQYAQGLNNSIKMAELMVTAPTDEGECDSHAQDSQKHDSGTPAKGATESTPIAVSTLQKGKFAACMLMLFFFFTKFYFTYR